MKVTRPRRSSEPWTAEEDNELRCMGHLSAKHVADFLGRSVTSIEARRAKLRKEDLEFAGRQWDEAQRTVDEMLESFHLFDQQDLSFWGRIKEKLAKVMRRA